MKWPTAASTWLIVAAASAANVIPPVEPLCSSSIANSSSTQIASDCDDGNLYGGSDSGPGMNSTGSFAPSSSSSSVSSSASASSAATSSEVVTGGSNEHSVNVTSPLGAKSPSREPRYRPLVDTIVGTSVLGAILLVGVAGNIMVVAVVAQTRSMRTPTNCYLVSLSVADLMVLLSAIPNEILAQYILEDEWIFGRVGCAMFVFFQYLGINASSLSITAFTVERYIAICLPMKAQTMCTVKRAKKIILAVWLFALCYCCPWLFFLTTTRPIYYRGQEHRYMETCTYSLQRSFYMRFFFADIILFYVIPLILSCVLYGRMARVLFHTDISAMTTAAKDANGQATAKANANTNNQSRIQVVKMLIVVVVLFATLWLPYRVLLVYNSFASKPYLELWYLMLCKTLIFVNSAINPVLYNAMSVKFRRAFRRTLSCGKHNLGQHRPGTPSGVSNNASNVTTTCGTASSNRSTNNQVAGAGGVGGGANGPATNHRSHSGRSPGNRSTLSYNSTSTMSSTATVRFAGPAATLVTSSNSQRGSSHQSPAVCRPVRKPDLLQQML